MSTRRTLTLATLLFSLTACAPKEQEDTLKGTLVMSRVENTDMLYWGPDYFMIVVGADGRGVEARMDHVNNNHISSIDSLLRDGLQTGRARITLQGHYDTEGIFRIQSGVANGAAFDYKGVH